MQLVFPRRMVGLGLALIGGLLVGLLLPVISLQLGMTSWFLATLPDRGIRHLLLDDHDADPDHEDEYDHIDVSRLARESLGLRRAMVTPESYTAWVHVPAAVVERPGVSDLHVVTRFEGIVEEILAVPGQAVREGDPLFRVRLTGDSLAAAQASLLDAVQQVTILDQEIERLRSAVQQGGLAGRSLLELEYERKRLLARKGTKRQELMIRGLEEEQIRQITDTEEMVRSVTIHLPDGLACQLEPGSDRAEDAWPFTIEALEVTPGSHVQPGDPLCNLAYHARLFLEGYAFERDIEMIAGVIENHYPVLAELGEAASPLRLEDLRIIHLDNHVDTGSQTYRFYVELQNEALQDSVRDDGRRYRTWRYKPGQRGHIGLPAKTFTGVFVLPSAAVVMDGLEHIVFRRQPTMIPDSSKHPSDDVDHSRHQRVGSDRQTESMPGEILDIDAEDVEEYVPVPVRVLHRDRLAVVVSADDMLQTGDVIAMNSAYQLLMAMKSSGLGHDHHHDH
jgi:membrane fusion protein, heavy metal efflux system